jgi:uncharacterized protein YwqG
MGIFDKVFKKKEFDKASEGDLAKYQSYLDNLKKPTIFLRDNIQKIFSKLGGLPSLPQKEEWPIWKGKPMSFLCQLDLSSLPKDDSFSDFPASGVLLFFYDQDQSTWGFNPEDRGSWKVIYSESIQTCKERTTPIGLENKTIFKEKFISFTKQFTYPGFEDERIGKLNMSNAQSDQYNELCEAVYGDKPHHQLYGYQSSEQSYDMDLECQLVTNGLNCGSPDGYHDPRAKVLEKGRYDWMLLLQLDTDDDIGMMWGDAGKLFFWIKKEDLKNRDFNNCWMILQCG